MGLSQHAFDQQHQVLADLCHCLIAEINALRLRVNRERAKQCELELQLHAAQTDLKYLEKRKPS